MDNLSTNPAPAPAGQNLVQVVMLAAMVALGGSFTMFLYGQWHTIGSDYRNVKTVLPEAQNAINDYIQNFEPRAKAFMEALQKYSVTHPDLNPILQKYGMSAIKPGAAAGPAPAGAGAASAVPAVPAAPSTPAAGGTAPRR